MLKTIIWKNLTAAEQSNILQRPAVHNAASIQQTQMIIDEVRRDGDNAIKKFSQLYDRASLQTLQVTQEEFITAELKINSAVKNAMQQAYSNIKKFHLAQLPKNVQVETVPGVVCELQYRAISKVGLYIPGGTARLPSTVLMLAIPAKIAGCSEIIIASPPQVDGSIDPHILYAAKLCGVDKVFKMGGAQAIAAMAFGTTSVPKVDKIFGPGNAWVTQAKILVSQDPKGAGYDLPAGPTEQMIIADQTAKAEFIAADLLSQAEHGVDSQVILLCQSEQLAMDVNQQIQQQLALLPRQEIARQALANSYAIIIDNLNEAIAIANQYAPEHLLLQIANPENYVAAIQNAGSVFLGHYAPESVGDYASGTNHVLPTYGYARSFSGLSLMDFMKCITFQTLTQQGLENIADSVELLAAIENLAGHERAVKIRRGTNIVEADLCACQKSNCRVCQAKARRTIMKKQRLT